ncbi:MAG: Trk system potassium transporter TrkA [Porphyromonas sp.]|nr:Trk system potassium transporter TrkA [Porphyromonas sp.]
MKIIIAGAGEVGTHLARNLAGEEQQDITLMDPDCNVINNFKRRSEIFSVVANPTVLSDLQVCQVDSADLFVSVMPDESNNLLACMMASRLGAKNTIARINNHLYLGEEYKHFFEQLGVNRLIYPEELAAREIADSLKHPWARVYLELLNGAFVLVGVKVRDGSRMVGKPLSFFKEEGEKRVHVVAIKRFDKTIIPRGTTRVESGDVVFFICLSKDIEIVRELTDKPRRKVSNIVILGGSLIAMRAIEKVPSNIHFQLVEKDPERIASIENLIPRNVDIYEGDGRDLSVLEELHMDKETVFVALTENSETNILACLAAKRFEVCKTIAKEENIDYIPLAEKLDIGTIINKKLIAAGYIYRALLGSDTKNVKSLSIARADVAELQAKTGSPITQKPVKDLDLPEGITLGGVVRNGIPYMIDGDTILQPYDNVIVFCTGVPMNKLHRWFSSR